MKLYRILALLCLVVACLGLAAFFGGMRSVKAGVFVFPLLLAFLFWYLYRKNDR